MEKTKIHLLILCLVCFGVGHLHGNSIADKQGCVKGTYTTQLGVVEHGNNTGPEIEQYIKATGFDQPIPWCAAFVSWVLNQCQVDNPASAWSPDWFPDSHTIYKQGRGREPAPGDVFGIYFTSKNRIAHVGFIHSWGDRYAITVEGNTNGAGSREGHGVFRKRRLKRQIYKVSRWI